jgi:hypothetical protein
MSRRIMVISRTQSFVLGFFVFAWISLLVILLLDPGIYDDAMKLSPGPHRLADLAFLVAISVVIALLSLGVLRRWRWTFWLILVAFLVGGTLRVPASVLELAGVLGPAGPTWYVVFQVVLGLIQAGIGVLMFAGYRREGPWGYPGATLR